MAPVPGSPWKCVSRMTSLPPSPHTHMLHHHRSIQPHPHPHHLGQDQTPIILYMHNCVQSPYEIISSIKCAAPAISAFLDCALGCAWLRKCALHLNGLQPQPQSGLLQHAVSSVLRVSQHLELRRLGAAAAPCADAVLKTLCALGQLSLAAAATSVSAAASAFASLVWWAWQHLLHHSVLVLAVCAKQCML